MSTRANIRITATDNTRGAFAKVTQSLRTMQGGVNSLLGPLRSLKSILPTLGLAILVKESMQAAEALRGMDARIRRVTEAMGDYNKVQAELYALSQRNGTALTETAKLFVSINRAAEDLGKGRDEVIQLTDTLQQLGVISGASGEAMKNSMLQFGQAMAGGVLRAEEFNSIVENTPEIAARMARGLGLTVGQLRLAVLEGRVLADDVFESLLSQADQIEADFSKMPLTINRAWQALKNGMSRFIADANEASGVTEGIASGIKVVADAIDDLNRRVKSGELRAEFALWIEAMGQVGTYVDWLKGKFAELTPSGSGIDFAWSDFFKDLPALMTIAFTEIFGVVDRGIGHINILWQKLPLLWDKMWLNIKTKTQEWWIQIRSLFESSVSFSTAEELAASSMSALQQEYNVAANAITADLREIERHQQMAADASLATVRAIREEQHARMDQRRGMVEVNAALDDLITNNNELFGVQSTVGRQVRETTTAIDGQTDATTNLTTSGRDLYKSMFDVTTLNLKKSFEENARAIDETTDSIFDMDEALKQVQNNFTSGLSETIYGAVFGDKEQLQDQKRQLREGLKDTLDDIAKAERDKKITVDEGIEQRIQAERDYNDNMAELIEKGTKSWSDHFKDFTRGVLDSFKRLLADMAAAWAASKVFKFLGLETGGVNFGGGDIVSSIIGGGSKLGSVINGGGIGGGIGSGAGGSAIVKAISTGISKGIGAIKGIFGGGTAGGTAAGGASFGTSLAAAGPVLAIGAFGFAQQRKAVQKRMENQAQFFESVGTGEFQELNAMAAFRGLDEATGEFFVTMNEGWKSTIEALHQANALIEVQGAMYDERGNELFKIAGNAEQVKDALSNAAATGFEFSDSLNMAIEKGNNLSVSIQGDSDAIQAALNAATAMGIGGFRDLEVTATGVSATLVGDIARWNEYLQSFVNEAIRGAINGVDSLGSQASTATGRFLELAKAAAKVRVPGATILGGRDAADNGTLPRFAEGGITRGPSLAGEAGPEAVIPLRNGAVPVVMDGGSSSETNALLREQNRLLRESLRRKERVI